MPSIRVCIRRNTGSNRITTALENASTGTLTSRIQASPASWWMAMAMPPTHMIGAVTSAW